VRIVCAAAVLLVACVCRGQAQTVDLAPITQLRKGVDAWPMLRHANSPSQQRVNATLEHLNQRLVVALKECDAGYTESLGTITTNRSTQAPVSQDWTRTIEVTMQGPRYLSMVASDEADCGGVHPNSSRMAMVFDLTTGAPVNWMALIAKSAGASSYSDSVLGGVTAGAVILPALQKIYVAKADPECRKAFDDPQPFQLWPNAKTGTLSVTAFDLPFVTAACADTMDLSLNQAAKLGVSKKLLDAIAIGCIDTLKAPAR
jgi:hypothetical protein